MRLNHGRIFDPCISGATSHQPSTIKQQSFSTSSWYIFLSLTPIQPSFLNHHRQKPHRINHPTIPTTSITNHQISRHPPATCLLASRGGCRRCASAAGVRPWHSTSRLIGVHPAAPWQTAIRRPGGTTGMVRIMG